ncbi:hypothetical protein F511_18381 [Dorcoceras hygrometricum]|uniref:Glutaredoxin domain-containing protein n=1 Tax=Dorcoceras hygrometricum TaxID=472368 RepID=A0A2Z7C527_9LAMI|nr:hypothetical protein F511_18381 [Dorcoceras hygrometricum]
MVSAMAFYSGTRGASTTPFLFTDISMPPPPTAAAMLHRHPKYSKAINFLSASGSLTSLGFSSSDGRKMSSVRCFSALTHELKTTLDKVVTSQKIVLFMKGTKEFPQCGFSNTVVQILKSLNVQFETIDILENDTLRQGLKEYSSWPTFPQLYIEGEFFGGCDITVEAYKSGELQEELEKANCS